MENWQNPEILSDNLLPAHAAFSEEALSLGGKWRFFGVSSDEHLPEGWTEPAFNDKKWDRISVPGTWEPENLPDTQSAPAGLYRKRFILSREQGSRQIILRFEAVTGPMTLWLNGTYIGKAPGTGLPVEFDITKALHPEKNMICLLLRRGKDLTGFPGDVTLYSLPARAITGLRAETKWSEDGSPLLHLNASVRDSDGFTLRIALMDDNRVLSYRECPVQDGTGETLIPCSDVELWCAEFPKLYRVGVILWDGLAVYHTRELTVGFRRVERLENTVLINGQKEKLYAAEYAALDPQSGCFHPREEMEEGLTTLREHHINAIMLQSPAPDTLFELCDRLGLYILDSSREQNRHHADTYGYHPAVIAWSTERNDPGILDMDSISVITDPDSSLCGLKTVLFSLPHYEGRLEPVIRKVRESDSILGAVLYSIPSRLREIGALLQPICFSYEDGTVTVTNLSRFRSTEGYSCRYVLTRDGEAIVTSELDLIVAPGETHSVFIETQYDIFRSGRYHLTVEFANRENGSILAAGQWEVGYLRHIFDENPGGTIREDQGSLLLRSGDASFTVNRTTGLLEQIQFRERTMMAASAWNDYAPTGEKSSGFLRPGEWEKLSFGRRKPKPSVFEVDHMTRTVSASYKLGSGLIQNYRLFSDGSLSFEMRLRTGRTSPSLLGVCIPLDQKLDLLRWFGAGPDDADPHRQAGLFFGVHTQRSTSIGNGAKEPVYHLTVSDNSGFGLMIRCADGLRASLVKSEHGNALRLELPNRSFKAHTTYTFSFTIQPVQE